MGNKNETEDNLRDLFQHHASHELEHAESTPFIDIHVDDEIELQFSYGALNLAAAEDSEPATEFLESQEDLKYEEMPDVWILGDDWTGERAYDLCMETLDRLSHEVVDVTYAVEQECPTYGSVAWGEIGEEDK